MGKERDFERFVEILKEATSRIEKEYFLLPVAGQKDAIYRERVYCYEFYHRLRDVFKEYGFQYSVAGEVDKKVHPILHKKIGALKPDIIVHIPGTMEKNLVVVEVKSIKADSSDIKKDLKSLIKFLKKAEYFRAVHLVWGGTEEEIKKYIRRSFEHEQLRFSNSLYLFWQEAHQEKAKICKWVELIRDVSED